jgi:hypothetical protein
MRHPGQIASFNRIEMHRVHPNGLSNITQAHFPAFAFTLKEPACFARRVHRSIWLLAIRLKIVFKTAVRILVHRRVLLLGPALQAAFANGPGKLARPKQLQLTPEQPLLQSAQTIEAMTIRLSE